MKKLISINTHLTTAALLVMAALSLPGCISTDVAADDAIRTPVHASDKYPITVAKGPQVLEVQSYKDNLSPSQINAVRGFIHQAMQAGVTPLTLERPSGGGNSMRVALEIGRLMVAEGVTRNGVDFRVYKAGSTAPVRVSFISTYAKTKPCGDWSKDLDDTSDNTSYPNLGCAVQSNLAAMIANPETLVVPKTVTPKLSEADVGAAIRADTYISTVNSTTIQNYKSSP